MVMGYVPNDDWEWEAHPEEGILRYPHMPQGWEIFVKYEPADGGWRCWANKPAERWSFRKAFHPGGPNDLRAAQEAALALVRGQ
jgi:hypothetical protein